MAAYLDPWDYIQKLSIKHCLYNDPLYEEGNKVCRVHVKVPCVLQPDPDIQLDTNINCGIKTVKKNKSTQLMCLECRQCLPSHHLLDLHLAEAHDSYFQVLKEKKPMYRCLLENCPLLFVNEEERKDHCIALHKFPSDYRFSLGWRQIKSKNTQHANSIKKNNKQIKTKKINIPIVDENHMDYEDSLIKSKCPSVTKMSMSGNIDETVINNTGLNSTKIIPRSIVFGHGVSRTFTRPAVKKPHWHQKHLQNNNSRKHIENIDMKDLENALEKVT